MSLAKLRKVLSEPSSRRSTSSIGTVVSKDGKNYKIRTLSGVSEKKALVGTYAVGDTVEFSGAVILRKVSKTQGLRTYYV